MNTIDSMGIVSSPNTLDGLNPVASSIEAASLLVDGTNAMQATLNVGGHKLINVINGTSASDGATVGQIASATAMYLPTSGGTMSGIIAMGNNKVTGVANGTVATDVAAFGQIASATSAYLPLAGGVMSGLLQMGSNRITGLANGTNSNNAATVGQLAAYLPLVGGSLTGAIAMGANKITGIGNGTVATDAAAFGQIASATSAYLPLAGGTMSGILFMGWNKIQNVAPGGSGLDAPNIDQMNSAITTATSSYLPKSGGTMTGPIAMGASKITGIGNGTLATDAAAFGQIALATAAYLPKAGGTMSGPIAMSNSRITGLADGVLATDAVTLGQVNTTYFPRAGGIITGNLQVNGTVNTSNININGNWVQGSNTGTPPTADTLISLSYLQNAVNVALANYLPLTGGTLTGNLQAPSNNIQSLSLSTGTLTAISSQSNTATIGSIDMSTTMSTGKITNLQPGTANGDAVNYSQLRAPPSRTSWNSGEIVNTFRCYQSQTTPSLYPNTLLNVFFPSGVVGSQTNTATLIHRFTYTPLQASNYIITIQYDMPFFIGGTGGDAWYVTMFGGTAGSGIRMATKTFTVVASNANRSQPIMPISGIYIADAAVSPPLTFGVYLDTSGSNDMVTMGSDQGLIWFTMQLTESKA